MSKAEARDWRKRWQLVNAREEDEVRSTPLEVKFQQFNTLLAWARAFGWTEALSEGEAEVRERWARLRKAYGGKKAPGRSTGRTTAGRGAVGKRKR